LSRQAVGPTHLPVQYTVGRFPKGLNEAGA